MHKRIAQLLIGSMGPIEYTEGSSAISYNARKESSLYNLRIFGNTVYRNGSVGDYNSSSKRYETTVRIHGRNFMGGEEFYSLISEKLTTATLTRVDNILTYDTSAITSYITITNPGKPAFKDNTVYTVRFHYTGPEGDTKTGLRIKYTDGDSEDIVASSAECDIAHVTPKGKTVLAITSAKDAVGERTLDLSSFGIFEGATEYSDFEEYNGSEYTLALSDSLSSIDSGENALFDTFDWKTKEALRRVCHTKIEYYHVSPYTPTRPIIVTITLMKHIDLNDPRLTFEDYVRKETYEEIEGNPRTYIIERNGRLLATIPKGYNVGNYQNEFKNEPKYLHYKLEEDKLTEETCIAIPATPKGYVGIEVYGNILPSKITAYYKN